MSAHVFFRERDGKPSYLSPVLKMKAAAYCSYVEISVNTRSCQQQQPYTRTHSRIRANKEAVAKIFATNAAGR
jgi:hypothetical protein